MVTPQIDLREPGRERQIAELFRAHQVDVIGVRHA